MQDHEITEIASVAVSERHCQLPTSSNFLARSILRDAKDGAVSRWERREKAKNHHHEEHRIEE
jgi:hypothetical protein